MGHLPKPLSNDELNQIRAKAQAAQNPQAKPATAEDVGYETGIKGLIPVVKRIEALEKDNEYLKTQLHQVQAKVLAAEKLLALGSSDLAQLLEPAQVRSVSSVTLDQTT